LETSNAFVVDDDPPVACVDTAANGVTMLSRRIRWRFSLRALFIAATLAGVACYWLVAPSMSAQRFIRAVAAGNFKLADTFFRDPDDQILSRLYEKHWRFHARAELQPWSFAELVLGERRIQLHLAFGDAGPMLGRSYVISVTQSGLLTPQLNPFVGGFGGIAI
jgi:hypothetical protein